MKSQLLGFFDALRQSGLAPSVGETIDAAAAVRVAGIDRAELREALAASLVKDHADRAQFDAVFDRYFALSAPGGRPKTRDAASGLGAGRFGSGEGRGQPQEKGRGQRRPEAPEPDAPAATPAEHAHRARDLARTRALAAKPFRDMQPRDVEELDALVAELSRRLRARFARRQRRAARGRVDMRRTLRRALSRGGVPIELVFRERRPRKPDLLALVDLSYSTATAAEFLLALLSPARQYFRRLTLLAYVDRPCAVSFEHGHVVPHEPLDLNARSDFGAVLKQLAERWEVVLGRNTVLLVLGDARNNRRPPRADLLARLHREVRRLVWLNPEPRDRWNTGDSAMDTYARHVDALLAASSPRTLTAALDELAL
ncbi:MAG: VWA domain-containing protein [Candidatus Binatia bacterium]